jgi:cobalt/nickel transport system permease protein
MIAVLGLAFVFSSLQGGIALAGMAVVTLILVALSGQRLRPFLLRLRWPGLVVAGVVLMLPFTYGTTPLNAFGLRAEGTVMAGTIALRFLCIFALVTSWLGVLTNPQLVAGLRGLGLPPVMTDMAMLALRHLADMRGHLARRETAMRLRGAARRAGLLQVRGWMLASLLLDAQLRSERVWQAMRLRGHGAAGAAPVVLPRPGPKDHVWCAGLAAAAVLLLGAEHLA